VIKRHSLALALAAGGIPVASAADLLQELAWGGPQSEVNHPVGDAGWELSTRVDVIASSDTRNHGLLAIRRTGVPLDGQATFCLTRNTAATTFTDYFPFSTYDWARVGVRCGTDPLAADSGKAQGSAFVGWCGPLLISAIGEVGTSADRGTVTSGEVSVFVLRAAGEHDDSGHWTSLGTGPRFLGSDLPFAGGLTWDHVWQFTDGLDWSGSRYALWMEWRFTRHFQLAVHGQLTTDVQVRAGKFEDVAQGTVGTGWAW
jgi:hypothetical protein